MSRLWLWCMMTWQKTRSEWTFSLLLCITSFILPPCLLQQSKEPLPSVFFMWAKDANTSVSCTWAWCGGPEGPRAPPDVWDDRYQHADVCVCGMCAGSMSRSIRSMLRRPAKRSHEELIVVRVWNVSLSPGCCLHDHGATLELLFFWCRSYPH